LALFQIKVSDWFIKKSRFLIDQIGQNQISDWSIPKLVFLIDKNSEKKIFFV